MIGPIPRRLLLKMGLALPASAATADAFGAVPPASEPASMAVLLAYNEFLHVERRLLAMEMYPHLGRDAERFVPCSTGAEQAFRICNPEGGGTPTERAVQMLRSAGLSIDELEARGAGRW